MHRPTTDSIWSQLGADLRRFIRRRVPDEHTADDLLQETFVRIHRGLAALDDSARLAGWVHRIARNVIHDHYRATDSAMMLESPENVAEPATTESPPAPGCGDACGWLPELIAELPPEYRAAIELAEQGLTQAEVAARLGLSLSGAKSRIQRGRVLLRTLFDACCRIHFDHAGRLTDWDPRPDRQICRNCGEAPSHHAAEASAESR